ncbi:hypothetical protein [Humidesulfovibrio sp.]
MGGDSDRTVVFVRTQKSVKDFGAKMEDLATRWFRLSSGQEMIIERVNGKRISYQGCGFGGSPREVFWGSWSEEFFEQEVPEIIKSTGLAAVESGADVVKAIDEAANLLEKVIRNFFSRMVEVDQRLSGNGITLGPRYDPTRKVNSLVEYTQQVAEYFKKAFTRKIESQDKEKEKSNGIVELKLNWHGLSIDFIELYRRIKRKFKHRV